MLIDTEKTQSSFDLLCQLLTSVNAEERHQGETWMFALMKNVFEGDKLDGTIAAIMSAKQRVEKVLSETLSLSTNPQVQALRCGCEGIRSAWTVVSGRQDRRNCVLGPSQLYEL